MPQIAAVHHQGIWIRIEMPDAGALVQPGLPWGQVEAFPTPAYWLYQALARRILGTTIHHRLGRTLAEEVGACLLGGHGIPAEVGLAAFERLRARGLLEGAPSEQVLVHEMSMPLLVSGRSIRYRFAAQKARYLSAALRRLAEEHPPLASGQALRAWLLQCHGIGPKTASWIARNWLDADDVAILDIHLLRAGLLTGFFTPSLTLERHYLQLEEQFIRFCGAISIPPAELDSVIWTEMRQSQGSVRRLMRQRGGSQQSGASD